MSQDEAPQASATEPAQLDDPALVAELSTTRRGLANTRPGSDEHAKLTTRNTALNAELNTRVRGHRR
jgi:hypothetical protein